MITEQNGRFFFRKPLLSQVLVGFSSSSKRTLDEILTLANVSPVG